MMKKYTLILSLWAVGCGEMPADDTPDPPVVAAGEARAGLRPGDTFSRVIPSAPVSNIRPSRWRPGAPLTPRGVTAQSFYYYFAGSLAASNTVSAIGYDVEGGRVLFEYEMDVRDTGQFLMEVGAESTNYVTRYRDSGGAGNVTPRCCIGPGFPEEAWSALYLMHEAHRAAFR